MTLLAEIISERFLRESILDLRYVIMVKKVDIIMAGID